MEGDKLNAETQLAMQNAIHKEFEKFEGRLRDIFTLTVNPMAKEITVLQQQSNEHYTEEKEIRKDIKKEMADFKHDISEEISTVDNKHTIKDIDTEKRLKDLESFDTGLKAIDQTKDKIRSDINTKTELTYGKIGLLMTATGLSAGGLSWLIHFISNL